MPKINTYNIDNLEKKIKKNLNIDIDAKNENLEDKINDFKSSFKNVSNNSIIEFMNWLKNTISRWIYIQESCPMI